MRDKPARPPRFFVDAELHAGEHLALPADAAHHAVRVLRLAQGNKAVLFNGRGGEYEVNILDIARNDVRVAVGARRETGTESPLAVTLLQGLSSNEHMDTTIQKSVELGVAVIQPVAAARSIVKLAPERARARLEHWRRVVISACEQCGRNRIPEVRPVLALADACRALEADTLRLLLAPQGARRLRETIAGAGTSIAVAVGPEAGFTAAEEEILVGAGFIHVRLGPRVLRTETAAPAVLAALAALHGDF